MAPAAPLSHCNRPSERRAERRAWRPSGALPRGKGGGKLRPYESLPPFPLSTNRRFACGRCDRLSALLLAQKSLRSGVILPPRPSEVLWREGIGAHLCASASLRLCVEMGGWAALRLRSLCDSVFPLDRCIRPNRWVAGQARAAPQRLCVSALNGWAGGLAPLLPLRLCVFPVDRCGYRTRWVAGSARAAPLRLWVGGGAES